ncbi:MAG: alanine--tRNA ligase [Anaerolineales bacterium]|jgi:alanyl-tRNA synthetase
MTKQLTGNQIRQQFIDFFVKEKGHTFVRSSSLVPGGDATLLFTNSGMVQFKDVFLGTDERKYSRAANSQKCMRVAGKHNDLEDVGFDDKHHTFFEMLGNWSFGDYYKKEAIEWAWELLTEKWGLPKEKLFVTIFKDEQGEIPTDEEAVKYWKQQPGLVHDHILYLGRKDNFWEMADTGPCGPNSEIHIDLGPQHGEITYLEDGQVDLDGPRFLELWNLVFIQYNRINSNKLEPLPATHVDTGLGFERIVAILQNQTSNYRTDLFWPIILKIQELAGHSDEDRDKNFTPYRVIADHARAAAFLIADGVVPGNLGRNYIARMIIRRASQFGKKINLNGPFLASVSEVVIENYGDAYPELNQNREIITDNITDEEERFQHTVEGGIIQLESLFKESKDEILDGEKTFDLYATFGLPFEITRDIAQERGFRVDEEGFQTAMEAHRIASGGGKAIGDLGGEDAEVFREIFMDLKKQKKLSNKGVLHDPYGSLEMSGEVLSIVKNGKSVKTAKPGDEIDIILPETSFYIEAGGQVSDTGFITSENGSDWEVQIEAAHQPAAGIISHFGKVIIGSPKVGGQAVVSIDRQRRQDIMRNHTATHLLHAELHRVLGDHARQAGSLVAPDRLRFDFTHSDPLTPKQLQDIEAGVNKHILENLPLFAEFKSLDEAKQEGAMALFGEKYGEDVRTIHIGEGNPLSNELCGGTHVEATGEIGSFLIINEGSVASGIRRIEAVTGRAAYELIQKRMRDVNQIAERLKVSPDQIVERTNRLLKDLNETQKQVAVLSRQQITDDFKTQLEEAPEIDGVRVLTSSLSDADNETLRQMADRFRQKYKTGVAVIASIVDGKPIIIATVTDDLVKKGWHAGELVNLVAEPVGGKGGGRPNLAQAGGKNAKKLTQALNLVQDWVEKRLAAD